MKQNKKHSISVNEFTSEEKNLEAMVEQLQRERKRLKRALARIGRGRGGLSEAEKRGLDEKLESFLAEKVGSREDGGVGGDDDRGDDDEGSIHVEDLIQAEYCFRDLRKRCHNARSQLITAAKRERRLRDEVERLTREAKSFEAAAQDKEEKEGKEPDYHPLLRGDVFIKYASNTNFGIAASAQPRFVWLSKDRKRIYWRPVSSKIEPSHIEVDDVIEVREGRNTAAFQRFPKGDAYDAISFSVITEKRTLDLEAIDLNDSGGELPRQLSVTWVRVLKRLL